jgi:hypothetical protein
VPRCVLACTAIQRGVICAWKTALRVESAAALVYAKDQFRKEWPEIAQCLKRLPKGGSCAQIRMSKKSAQISRYVKARRLPLARDL